MRAPHKAYSQPAICIRGFYTLFLNSVILTLKIIYRAKYGKILILRQGVTQLSVDVETSYMKLVCAERAATDAVTSHHRQ